MLGLNVIRQIRIQRKTSYEQLSKFMGLKLDAGVRFVDRHLLLSLYQKQSERRVIKFIARY